MACSQQKIWAYETNWGSFAEYCLVQAQQLLPKPPHLTWEEAASYGLDLLHRLPHAGRPGRRSRPATTCWSGAPAAASASLAIQLCKLYGANAIAVVSREDKADLCRRLGAHEVINRREFALADRDAGEPNLDEVKRFGKAVREATGGDDCDIVFEHVGSATFFTSVFVCKHVRQDRHLRRDVGLLRSTSTCATCGCGRRRSSARTSPTPTRPTAPTS